MQTCKNIILLSGAVSASDLKNIKNIINKGQIYGFVDGVEYSLYKGWRDGIYSIYIWDVVSLFGSKQCKIKFVRYN